MEKIDHNSLNVEKENIEKIKKMFPNCVADGKINFDILKELLGDEVDDNKEKYQFTWNGKAKAIKLAQTPSTSTLMPCKEKSNNWDTTKNLYIEGDNLEVLKQMQKTYFGKIKMIYIDPPYNTGNDFVYKDDFKSSIENYKEQTEQQLSSNAETNGRYHTDWLNLMYPRLILAKNLLREDGVMFISIDDNEVENLIKIGKEVFGDANYINSLKWKRKKQPSFLSRHIAPVMEYILIFAKNSNFLRKLSIEKVSDNTKKVINISNNESQRIFKSGVEVKGLENGIIPKGIYTVKTMNVEYLDDVVVKDSHTINTIRVKAQFLNTQDKITEFIDNGLLFITAAKGLRRYVSAEESEKEKAITDLILDWGDNQDSEKEQKEIFGHKYFDYTKPTKLIYNLAKSCTENNDIVLDFFSGSATTAHAVLNLNLDDESNRSFIMVQLPESIAENNDALKAGFKTICDIGEERIRRAGEQIKKEWIDKNKGEGLFEKDNKFPFDIGFKVFKLDSTNIKPWDNTSIQDENSLFGYNEVFKEDRTKEDVLYEIMLKYGIFDQQATPEVINGKEMYKVGSRYMIVCLEDNITAEDVKKISELKPRVVVFKENGFANDNDKINATYNLEKAGVEDIRCI